MSQFQSTASVYAPSQRQYNELEDEDGVDIRDQINQINQEFNDEYQNDNGEVETETGNEKDFYLSFQDSLSQNYNPTLSSMRGGDSGYYPNNYNNSIYRPSNYQSNRGQFTYRKVNPNSLQQRQNSSRYYNSMRDPSECALESEIADESDVQTGYEIEAVKPRAVVASQSDF